MKIIEMVVPDATKGIVLAVVLYLTEDDVRGEVRYNDEHGIGLDQCHKIVDDVMANAVTAHKAGEVTEVTDLPTADDLKEP